MIFRAGQSLRSCAATSSRCAARCATNYQARLFRTGPQLRQGPNSVLSLLETRGLVNQIAGDRKALDSRLQTRKVGFYAGIDPTAPSLHLGHLLPLMVLFWLHRDGHHVVSLLGGATAKVGDPSGRLVSRTQTAETVIQNNLAAMSTQLGELWQSAIEYATRHGTSAQSFGKLELLDNSEWLDKLNVLQFLRIMGNGMRVGTMLGRDTVRNKMEKGDGMSFSEFTYPLLQAWDWWQMFRDRAVQVQIGGSDQYGNIIAGIDAVKHIAQQSSLVGSREAWFDGDGRIAPDTSPMGLTVPLLTTASGEKFGKSAGNAIWLDANLTSPFDLYGFLLRSSDDDVERYLKLFTFVPVPEIHLVMVKHSEDRSKRTAQHLLASEVLELVHGRQEAERVRTAHQAMRAPTLTSLSSPMANASASASPSTSTDNDSTSETPHIRLPYSLIHDTPASRILFHAGIATSKSEGARMIAKGGVYIASPASSQSGPPSSSTPETLHFTPVSKDLSPSDTSSFLINGLMVLRLGKWKVRVIQVVEDAAFDAASPAVLPPGWEEFKMRRNETGSA